MGRVVLSEDMPTIVASEVQYNSERYSSFHCVMLVCFTVGVFLVSCGCALSQTSLSTSEKQDLLATLNLQKPCQPHRDQHADNGEVSVHVITFRIYLAP